MQDQCQYALKWNTSITVKPNPSKQHLFNTLWLDKSYICSEAFHIIQLFEDSSNSEENLKILKIVSM